MSKNLILTSSVSRHGADGADETDETGGAGGMCGSLYIIVL